MKEKWNRFKKFMTEPTPENKYSKYYYVKTYYMRKVHSNIFYLYLFGIGLIIPDLYFMPVVLVLVLGWIFAWYYDAKFDKEFYNPLNSVHHKLTQRYLKIINNLNAHKAYEPKENEEQRRITGMLETLEENIDIWPPDKSSRWLGFIQAYMIKENHITIQEERDFSRPLFHNAYKKLGYNIPKSVSI